MLIRIYLNALLVSLLLIGVCRPLVGQNTDSTTAKPVAQSIPDTLLFKIQKAQSVITQIKAADKKKYGITRVRAGLATVKTTIAPVAADVRTHGKTIDSKNLSNYSLILNDALKQLTDWRTLLSRSSNDLQGNLDQVLALSTDSLLTVASTDSTDKKLYADQLAGLKGQLQDAGTRTSARLDTVSRLLADVSGTYLTISNLQTAINERLDKSTENAFRKESPYLWEAPSTVAVSNLPERLLASYRGQAKIVNYFFASTWDNRLLLLLLTGTFFVWVLANYRKARTPSLRPTVGSLQLDNLKPVPVAASLLVLLNLPPLFEPQSPSVYIEITQFLLFLVIVVHLWERFSLHEMRLWLVIGAMYIVLIIANSLVDDSLFMRLGLLVLNAGFMYIGIAFARRLPRQHVSARIVRMVTLLYLLLQGLAIVFNIIGRISLAKTVGITAVISLVQLAGLGLFIEVVLEALELQINISACSQGLFSRVNVSHVRRSFKKGLAFIAVALWLIVFFINLGVADEVYNLVSHLLTRPRSFGSISFTLSNVLSFSVVLYLSSLLQKNIGLLFGESSFSTADEQVGQLSSVLALVRLVILIAGILLAIAASGISIDKFTVVLGALSVGIGLGMQNIVSNFVSGIILIFEKPFQIGDYVELADKKGRIRDIGIRSSRMITAQGSEVIIPNGDLLSNRLVNWTSSDVYLKTEITLKVSSDTDLQRVQEIMTSEVSQVDGAIKNRPPEIVVTTIGGDSVELKVQVWISSIYAEVNLKSQLLQRLLPAFREAAIKLM
ncbi:mechanosensitive ion channel family protein [Spirosoma utsteinense]|uniref:Small-conductance mechanosensitive channel n=1 Tax=Spirosoma utsteinense TaxID=2585773 RepID=A0ABR6W915_9BACT|nr:mechanosensitive ion channel domain-containing protein [Spirosoma utsteinense]MBC3787738.1 small-conductance mechanosensitive channel [Spirosoma utsteinense]MBC3792658.1 small-conductance mechanosensitive channel [Spirosoma utsteinense]